MNDDIISVFTAINQHSDMERFFEEIFTPAERRDLSLRWKLMRLLKQGIAQRQIASELGVSLCKITRGAGVLRDEESISNRLLDKIKKDFDKEDLDGNSED